MADGWAQVLAGGPHDLHAALLHSVHADLRAAREALDRHDAAHAAFLAHRLKGSARLMGDDSATALCTLLEAAGRAGAIEHIRSLWVQVEHAFGIALARLDDGTT